MKINGSSIQQARPVVQTGVASAQDQAAKRGEHAGGPSQGVTRASREDSVQISDAARALAGGEAAGGPLTPERTAELRRKVLEGAYNSMNVVDHVAKRILERGDA